MACSSVAKSRRAGGTRTTWDVLRHPLAVLRDPRGSGASAQSGDVDALATGEARELSCFLRSDAPGLPDTFSQGTLRIAPSGMTWRRYWRHRDQQVQIPPLDRIQQVRPVGGVGERNIKRGLFRVVVASGPSGVIEFAVPGVGPELIRRAVERDAR